jgi:hypothetical protein
MVNPVEVVFLAAQLAAVVLLPSLNRLKTEPV